VWSAEKRAEGAEYMQPKSSSHSGRIVGKPEIMSMVDVIFPISSLMFIQNTLMSAELIEQVFYGLLRTLE
jgi:hypothetical protein